MKIGIVNYSIGNVGSVYSAFKFYNFDCFLINEPKELSKVDIIVLAGVGNFITAVSKLKELQMWDRINEEVITKKKPVVGICLGMQLFADVSYEDGETMGFGWIEGEVTKIKGDNLKIPHIGWNGLEYSDNRLFAGMRYNSFYFMHSYHFIPKDEKVVVARTKYGNLEFISAVRKDNIIGVQFHPEKSQGDGLRLLRNIVEALS